MSRESSYATEKPMSVEDGMGDMNKSRRLSNIDSSNLDSILQGLQGAEDGCKMGAIEEDESPGDESPGDELPGDESPGNELPGDDSLGDELPGDG